MDFEMPKLSELPQGATDGFAGASQDLAMEASFPTVSDQHESAGEPLPADVESSEALAPELLSESGMLVSEIEAAEAPGENIEPVALPPSTVDWSAPDSPMFNQETLPAHPAPGEDLADRFDEQFAPDGAFQPPRPGGNFKEPTPYDAIAQAAFAAPPPEPEATDQRTDLPTPKGPIPPEIKAAQLADAQRQAAVAANSQPPHAMPAPGSSYDSDLLIPKDLPVPTHSQGLPAPSARPNSMVSHRPVPLPGAQEKPERDPWRNPSVPRMNAVRPEAPPPNEPAGPRPFDEAHYRSVYQQFIESKTQLGESVENLSYDGFRNKLRSSEESLLDRHGCRAVRFQVLVKDRTVSLRPQLVR